MKKNKSGSFFRSLRFRILVILFVFGIVPGAVMAGILYVNYEDHAIQTRTEKFYRQCEILSNIMIRENYLNDSSSQTVNSKLELLSNLAGGRVLVADRDFRIVKDTYGIDKGKILVSALVVKMFRGEKAVRYDKDGNYIELSVPVRSPEVKQLQGAMLVTVSTRDIRDDLMDMLQTGLIALACIAAAAVVFAYFLSKSLVKPLARITRSIEDLTDGYQDETISVADYTETALITDAFNKMVTRMKVLDDSRSEFVSNVSHELKTPMTSMKVLADSLVGQQGISEELYQEFLQDITREIDRENKIITDLLALVRMDKKASDMHIEHRNINVLLEEILKRLKPIARQRNIDLIFDSIRPVEADVDEVKFTLAISNLVENGIKYNVDDGWVRVTLDADHKEFTVTVEDSGLGIPEDSLERIFERFYRVDKSHSREIGGTGLGLSITKSTVAMHNGKIKVASKEGEGTTFTIRIPLSYIP